MEKHDGEELYTVKDMGAWFGLDDRLVVLLEGFDASVRDLDLPVRVVEQTLGRPHFYNKDVEWKADVEEEEMRRKKDDRGLVARWKKGRRANSRAFILHIRGPSDCT